MFSSTQALFFFALISFIAPIFSARAQEVVITKSQRAWGNPFKNNESTLSELARTMLSKTQNPSAKEGFQLGEQVLPDGSVLERKLDSIVVRACTSIEPLCNPLQNISSDGTCDALQIMSDFNDREIQAALKGSLPKGELGQKLETKLSQPGVKYTFTALYESDYSHAVKELYQKIKLPQGPSSSHDLSAKAKEDRSLRQWLAIVTLRGLKTQAMIQKLYPHTKISLDLKGDPEDQMNNANINPVFVGTCGPVPKNEESAFSRKCTQASQDPSSVWKQTCQELDQHYAEESKNLATPTSLSEKNRYIQWDAQIIETTNLKNRKPSTAEDQILTGQKSLKKLERTEMQCP